MNTEAIKLARQMRLARQARRLHAVDQNGRPVLDDDGKQYFDLNRAPLVLEDLDVPQRLASATFAGSKFKYADDVREWFANTDDEYCAVLIGDGGNYTAAAVLHNAVRRGLTICWRDWHTLTHSYTERITRDRVLTHGSTEEASAAAEEVFQAEDEEEYLRQVYDVLAIIEFDIGNVRDFAVPEICAMIRNRTAFGLITVVTVPTAESGPMDVNPTQFGARGSLLRLFEHEARVFDGR